MDLLKVLLTPATATAGQSTARDASRSYVQTHTTARSSPESGVPSPCAGRPFGCTAATPAYRPDACPDTRSAPQAQNRSPANP